MENTGRPKRVNSLFKSFPLALSDGIWACDWGSAAMRLFDVEEARRLVPALGTAFGAIRGWLERIQESNHQLKLLAQPAVETLAADFIGRSEQLRAQRDGLIAQVRQEVAQLEEFGVEVKSLEGLVDFHALRNGRPVCLCWQFGEPTVIYWHELDAGFRGRQPIEDASAFAPSYLS